MAISASAKPEAAQLVLGLPSMLVVHRWSTMSDDALPGFAAVNANPVTWPHIASYSARRTSSLSAGSV